MNNKAIYLLIFLALFSCENRDGPMGPRDNPDDSARAPSISGTADTRWYDYNHELGYGSIKLTFKADDPNLPHDTINYRIFIATDQATMRELLPESDSICILDRIAPDVAYRCSLFVIDSDDSSATAAVPVMAPAIIPPFPPEPVLTAGNTTVTITWSAVDGATGYAVYASANRNGPYALNGTYAQPSAGAGSPVTIDDPIDEYTSRYYIVASVNTSGGCRSHDTLFGRRYSDGIAVPSIESVSQGASPDFIKVTWHADDPAISHFEIYRSSAESGSYRLIAVIKALPATATWNDSDAMASNNCYKIAAVDKKGRAGKLSAAACGFLYIELAPTFVTVKGFSDHIALSWTAVPGAGAYWVFRSPTVCPTGMTFIATTTSLSYRDSITTFGKYHYAVATIDSSGHIAAVSNCETGSLSLLPAPEGIQLSDSVAPHTISLTWSPLPGAAGYIIHRSSTYCPKDGEEFARTTATFFRDTVVTTNYYYYAVSAVDKANREGTMSLCFRGSAASLPSPQNLKASSGTYPDMITLSWNALSWARYYVIYRSAISCSSDMVKIDSTQIPVYTDRVKASNAYYYLVAGIDSMGIGGLTSDCSKGSVTPLPAPGNVTASYGTYVDRILISWDAVVGADGYIIYKGTSNLADQALPLDTVTSLSKFDNEPGASLTYYWVAARNTLGAGTLSECVYGKALILIPPDLSINDDGMNDTVKLTWEVDPLVIRVDIYRSADDGYTFDLLNSTTNSFYSDIPPAYNAYAYYIVAKTASEDSCFSYTVSGSRIIPPLTGLSATAGEGGVLLHWNSIPGIHYYFIYRSESAADTGEIYDEVFDDTTYFDYYGMDTQYYYRVQAANDVRDGPISEYIIGPAVAPSPPEKKTAPGIIR